MHEPPHLFSGFGMPRQACISTISQGNPGQSVVGIRRLSSRLLGRLRFPFGTIEVRVTLHRASSNSGSH